METLYTIPMLYCSEQDQEEGEGEREGGGEGEGERELGYAEKICSPFTHPAVGFQRKLLEG